MIKKKQHERDVRNKNFTNSIYEYLRLNEEHNINREKIIVLDNESNWKGRKSKEAVCIHGLNLTILRNPSKIMNLKKGFRLDAICS